MHEHNARIEVSRRDIADAWAERVVDALAGYGPAVSRGPTGCAEVIITVPATDLRQAFITACALARDATESEVVAAEVMTTAEWDRRHGLEPLPELLSVTQVADALGVSRQAVLQRLESGSLSGVKVGNAWVIQAPVVTAAT